MPHATDNTPHSTLMDERTGNRQAPRQADATQPSVVREPPTGREFLEKLRDGRVIYFDGELVKDVTTHPAFATSARSYARLYDTLHDPEKRDLLTFVTERGARSHKFYKLPRTHQDLFEARDAIAEWARLSWGALSRGPDYKAALVGTLAGDADSYGEFAPNVRRWCEKITDEVMFVNLSLANPAGDRSKPPAEQRDVYMHVVKERDDGIVVRGARMVSTGAAFSHVTYLSQYIPVSGLAEHEEDFALGFFLPFNAPGLKFIGRYSYEHLAKKIGSPFDYPLSSRFDESDLGIVLDDVFIPWEDVIAYRNPKVVNGLFPRGFAQRFAFHAAARTAVKLDFICGLLLRATEMQRTTDFRGVQALLGELLGMRHNIWALSTAMAAEAQPGPGGYLLPNLNYALQWRNVYGDTFTRARTMFHNVLAGNLIQIPSSARDFKNPDSRQWIDRYWKGATDTAEERVKLIRLIWDLFLSEFAGRTEAHERNFAGGYEANRVETYLAAEQMGLNATLKAMVDECMSHYDLNGWIHATWADVPWSPSEP
jgi:4-hydroxyphenylacetate 3-monooxygenase